MANMMSSGCVSIACKFIWGALILHIMAVMLLFYTEKAAW